MAKRHDRIDLGDLILIITVPGILILAFGWVTNAVLVVANDTAVLITLRYVQTIPALMVVFAVLSMILLVSGVLTLFYFPLSLSFEFGKKRSIYRNQLPMVSVIIPAYNEELVLHNCVSSVLRSDYPDFEVILVDDGSKDDTLRIMREFESNARVRVIPQVNSGKAAALNTGMQAAGGDVLFFVDADGLFKPDTIRRMLSGFTSKKVGAVCGNDEPVNTDRLQTRLITLQSHIGTGFVRRALARINCLPIVSGNIGAFRREALQAAMGKMKPTVGTLRKDGFIQPFLEGFIGEDLELTWRVHASGYRVNFAPRAMVLSEVPSTLKDLWKQRVRWARGFLQTVRIHRRMFFSLKHGMIGLYLPVNYFNMVILPFLQILLILIIILLSTLGYTPLALNLLGLILWLGMGSALIACLWAVSLDHAWRDLKYIYVLILWIPYSMMMNLVMVWAVLLELSGRQASWNKVQRTGKRSRT